MCLIPSLDGKTSLSRHLAPFWCICSSLLKARRYEQCFPGDRHFACRHIWLVPFLVDLALRAMAHVYFVHSIHVLAPELWASMPFFPDNDTLMRIIVDVNILSTSIFTIQGPDIDFRSQWCMPCVTCTMLLGKRVVLVSWLLSDIILRGTKGDNGAAKDLGGAKKVKGENGKDMMEVEIPTAREDVDRLWAASRSALKIKPHEEKEHRDAATKQADQDRNSRTNVVLAWVGTNMWVICARSLRRLTDTFQAHDSCLHLASLLELGKRPFCDISGFELQSLFDLPFHRTVSKAYILIWASSLTTTRSAVLSAVRFMGSILYLIFRLFGN